MFGIALEIHVCDQRRSYLARFSTEAQALAFVSARTSTHAIREVHEEPIGHEHADLIDFMYPNCEHGLSLSNCYGPQHYYRDEEEQQRG